MKKLLTAFLCGAAVLLSAETLKEWKFEGNKISGLSYPSEKIGFRISPDVKTPEGGPCGEFTVKSAGDTKVPWSTQINFASLQNIKSGSKYRCSLRIRGTGSGTIAFNCIQARSPWKEIGKTQRVFSLRGEWQTASTEFTAAVDYEGPLRTPMLMVGNLAEGTVFQIGPITFERIDDAQK